MTKTFTGMDVLRVMENEWVIKSDERGTKPSFAYMIIDGTVMSKRVTDGAEQEAARDVNYFFKYNFVVYEEPIVAGDTVKITIKDGIYYGEVSETGALTCGGESYVKIKGSDTFFNMDFAVRIDKAEWDKLQREEMFKQHGRELDEFTRGDVVELKDSFDKTHTLIVGGMHEDGTVQFIANMSSKHASELTPIEFIARVKVAAPTIICEKTAPVAKGSCAPAYPATAWEPHPEDTLNPYLGGNK